MRASIVIIMFGVLLLSGCTRAPHEQAVATVTKWQRLMRAREWNQAYSMLDPLFALKTFGAELDFRLWASGVEHQRTMSSYTRCRYASKKVIGTDEYDLFFYDRAKKSYTRFLVTRGSDGVWRIKDFEIEVQVDG